MEDKVQLFEDQPIRTAWVEDEEEWYFSIVDVVGALTEQSDMNGARNYWKVLKSRLKEEGNQLVTNCNQMKMTAQDGKKRFTDVANTEQLLRIIQFRYNKKEGPIGPSSGRRHRKFLQPDHCYYMRTDNCCKYIANR